MEANQFVESEISKVLEELKVDENLFLSSDEIEIRDYFYSTCEELGNKGLSIKESLLIARERFGNPEFNSEDKSSSLLTPLFAFIFGILFAKQAFILYFVARPRLIYADEYQLTAAIPYLSEITFILNLMLIGTFVFTIITLFQLFVLKRTSRIQKLKEYLIGFEFVFICLFFIECLYNFGIQATEVKLIFIPFNLLVAILSIWYFRIFDKKLKEWTVLFLRLT